VQAIPTLNYSRDWLPSLTTSAEHVFVVNAAQIAYGTLNVNETLALAARQAATLATLLHHESPPAPVTMPPLSRTRSVPAAPSA
jgi:hypothetical protein